MFQDMMMPSLTKERKRGKNPGVSGHRSQTSIPECQCSEGHLPRYYLKTALQFSPNGGSRKMSSAQVFVLF